MLSWIQNPDSLSDWMSLFTSGMKFSFCKLEWFFSSYMFSSLTRANLPHISWNHPSNFPLASLSNNPSTSDCPTKQFKHSVFSGAQPEFRWEKTLRRLQTFWQDFLQKQRESCLVEGPLSAASAQETFGKKNPAPAQRLGCLLSLFFFPETSVFLLSVIHISSSKCIYWPGKWCIFSL